MKKYCKNVEKLMKRHCDSLNEKDRRRYAAVETLKLGWGGKQYIGKILDIDYKTIVRGIEEINNGTEIPSNRIRKKGGGRKKIIDTTDNIDKVFLAVLETNTTGSPMKEEINRANLTQKKIAELMRNEGIEVSKHVVKQLLIKHGFALPKTETQ